MRREANLKDIARQSGAQQREMGVTHYRWRFLSTRSGCRHADREGQEFAWELPPSGGHPGEVDGCACYAEAVLAGLDDLGALIWHGPGPNPHINAAPVSEMGRAWPELLKKLWRKLRVEGG
jgi:hypothetical protein